jgi:hypothetical protein
MGIIIALPDFRLYIIIPGMTILQWAGGLSTILAVAMATQ